jgi:hypothetical protein
MPPVVVDVVESLMPFVVVGFVCRLFFIFLRQVGR